MRLDLHMHPLSHQYYNGRNLPHHVKELTSQDKQRIETVVDWNVKRGMDVISITDHDMVLPSLYAIEYAKEQKLPITIVPGIEMEIYHLGERTHLCAWGIWEQPKYHYSTSIKELVDQIHALGGIISMNHPYYSPGAFFDTCHLIDGYEYWNGGQYDDGGFFLNGDNIMKLKRITLKQYYNSDFHYDPCFRIDAYRIPTRCNDWSEEETKVWLNQFKL